MNSSNRNKFLCSQFQAFFSTGSPKPLARSSFCSWSHSSCCFSAWVLLFFANLFVSAEFLFTAVFVNTCIHMHAYTNTCMHTHCSAFKSIPYAYAISHTRGEPMGPCSSVVAVASAWLSPRVTDLLLF